MRITSFSVTCTSGANTARLTGDICYMGVPFWSGFGSTSAYSSYSHPRYALLNVVATNVSGGDFTATYSCEGVPGSYSYDTGYQYAYPQGIFNPRVRKSTNGASSVSWDDSPEPWVNFDYTVYGGRQTAMMRVYFVVNWGGEDVGVYSSNVALADPWHYYWYERPENAMWLKLDGNGGQVATYTHSSSGNTTPESLFGFIPSTASSSITVTGNRPTRSGYRFAYWNTAQDGSGTTYQRKSEWYGDHVDSENTMRLYAIWSPNIYFDANGGSGNIPNTIEKTFNQSASIPSIEPTHTTKMFLSWNTARDGSGTTYQRGGTIPASMNTSVTLYAQWRDPTPAPTISSVTVYRCDSSGTADDLGTYARVSVSWSVSRRYDDTNTGTLTATIGSTSITFGSGTSGASGTATAIVPNISEDQQYTVTARVTDTNRDTNHTATTTRSAILTRAKFIMDFRAGGNAVGIGSAAPQSGLLVGYNATFNKRVTLDGVVENGSHASWSVSMSIWWEGGGNSDVSYVFENASGFTADRVELYACGPMRGAHIGTNGTLTGGSWTTIGQIRNITSTEAYLPRYMPAYFAWDGGIGRINTSGTVELRSFSNYGSIINFYARYF